MTRGQDKVFLKLIPHAKEKVKFELEEKISLVLIFSRLLRLQATSFKSPMVKSLLKTYWISSKARIKQKHNNIVAT